MSTRLEYTYPCPADVETAFAALSSEAWAQRKAEVLRDGSTVVRREARPDGGVLLVVSRELPDGVPGYLERFLPADGRVVQSDDWGPAGPDGSRSGTWRVELAGAPAEVGGTMRLEPAGSGCSWSIDGTVRVSVPLIGGKAERLLSDLLGRLTAKEADVLRGLVG